MLTFIGFLIAGVGVLIAYFQWRTAHQRVVLDLFDRRMRVFEDVERAVGIVLRSTEDAEQAFRLFIEAKARARFLFGDDVNGMLENVLRDLAWLSTYTTNTINSSANRQELITQKYKAMRRLGRFLEGAPKQFAPYVKLDQKMPNLWLPF